MIQYLRFFAILEGISYLLFGITMPLKRYYELIWPNKIVGYAHGFLFIIYVILCLVAYKKYNWSFKTLFLCELASLLPFGTFVADKKVFKPKFISNSR